MPKKNKRPSLLHIILCALLLLLGFICFFSGKWYVDVYGRLGFDSVIYTLSAGLSAVESNLITSFLSTVIPRVLLGAALVCIVLFYPVKKKVVLSLFGKLRLQLFPFHKILSLLLSIAISLGLIVYAAYDVELTDYINSYLTRSTIFEDTYRDPNTTKVTFPEQKRNLIYIMLESMETSYLSTELGGGVKNNLIPELYELAQDNLNFSHNDSVGGFYSGSGASWTIAAMVSQTAGVPLKTPPGIDGNDYGQDGSFLPGLTTINNMLHDNGYNQALMVGSDAVYGGRAQYYTSHGVDTVYDLFTARAEGIVPEDYSVWWGMEDLHLYEYAKQKITEMAAQDSPFAFTMLTVDTHHVGGYICEECGSDYEEQYENVIACASRQAAKFVKWIQEQDFYENTTIVLVGDHPSMDNSYFQRNAAGDCQRTVYNCIINPAAQATNTANRRFMGLDMFPTTLAAMGCKIEGNRLGLGTNLFSDMPTLAEEMGHYSFNTAMSQTSMYYLQKFYNE